MRLQARATARLAGRITAPGDKSISHRALLLAAMAQGETRIEGLLEGADVLATADAMRAFGADVERRAPGAWRVRGRGSLAPPAQIIDCGNSGTGVRLIMGAAAGYPLEATFTGDASLQKRPMGRVLEPLTQMGARVLSSEAGRLPVTLAGGGLRAIRYRLPVASAQVKSAILLAALNADGVTEVIEPQRTRDHTERMLRAFGADLATTPHDGGGAVISMAGGQTLSGAAVRVPADPSSAAFPIVAGLLAKEGEVRIDGVLLNPLRAGLFETLQAMGADLAIDNAREESGESIGDVIARPSRLRGIVVPPERAPSMIDEYPILAVAAAFADGDTVMRGIGELRVKESDRIALMAAGLKACGVDVQEEEDGLIVRGMAHVHGGAEIATHGDHRIAMAHLVLGLAAEQPVNIDEAGMIATSFPGFAELMRSLGAEISEV
ncbi:MAG: 3-phosphoshikimate 1-carboxyvinyltransferase [Alphaproteobacteria bacterium]|nr:3-phosphoshikimate 1-carboxyvinyltransferase [Alphaproteobacteria bacterium]